MSGGPSFVFDPAMVNGPDQVRSAMLDLEQRIQRGEVRLLNENRELTHRGRHVRVREYTDGTRVVDELSIQSDNRGNTREHWTVTEIRVAPRQLPPSPINEESRRLLGASLGSGWGELMGRAIAEAGPQLQASMAEMARSLNGMGLPERLLRPVRDPDPQPMTVTLPMRGETVVIAHPSKAELDALTMILVQIIVSPVTAVQIDRALKPWAVVVRDGNTCVGEQAGRILECFRVSISRAEVILEGQQQEAQRRQRTPGRRQLLDTE